MMFSVLLLASSLYIEWSKIIIFMQKDTSEKSTAIKVFVRVRPLVGQEVGTNEVVSVEEDVTISTSRVKLSKSQLTQCRSSKPNSTKPSLKNELNAMSSVTFRAISLKFQKVTTSLYSPMGKLVPEKPIQCLAATGKVLYLST